MSKKKLLLVTQETQPYTAISMISEVVMNLAKKAHESGFELRILMPRFGTINERRHKLHEVVRLSGMNIIVDDDDYPLIIKVASMPGLRLQVYFLDNEEFFKRKSVFADSSDELFEDNEDRMVFFCKGALSTVKKFGWAPDIIHCHGWMTSLIPMYLKKTYKDDPLFENTQIVSSIYNSELSSNFTEDFEDKMLTNHVEDEDVEKYTSDGIASLRAGAIQFSDGVIFAENDAEQDLVAIAQDKEVPFAQFDSMDPDVLPDYIQFYQSLIEEDIEE